jgi:cytochrome c oxidase assembly protein subunit 15
MHVESSALARVRSFELSPAGLRRLAVASAVSLYAVIISGTTVRLTASGLGCESWPGCEPGSFFPASDYHAYVEFGNRAVALFPLTLTLLAWLGARRTPGLERWVGWTALGTLLGTVAQAPLGLVTIRFDLHPLLVLAHFLLALVVLGGAVTVAVEAWANDRGRAASLPARRVRTAAAALAVGSALMVVSGTFATAAGPHSGDPSAARLGELEESVHIHVVVSTAFAALFAASFVLVWLERRRFPGLLRLALVLAALLGAQAVVGEVQYRTQLPWGVVLLHVSLAAAIWAATIALAAAAYRAPASLARPGT